MKGKKLLLFRNDKHPSHIAYYLHEWKFRENKKLNFVVYVKEQQSFFCSFSCSWWRPHNNFQLHFKKKRDEKNVVPIHLARSFFLHIRWTATVDVDVVACLLSISLTHTMKRLRFAIVWNILYASVQVNGRHILFMDIGYAQLFVRVGVFSWVQTFFIVTKSARASETKSDE